MAVRKMIIKFPFKRKVCPVLEVKLPSIVCFRFNEKYLIGKRVPKQKPREITSQNCYLIGYSTHVASNFIMRGIKKFTEKLCLLFSQRFSTI